MLPSFRLIVATFLFGFVLVFAGLRVAAITRLAHDSLPGLATPAVAAPAVFAQAIPAAPVAPPIASVPAADPPRIDLVVPVLFDLNSVIIATALPPPPPPLPPAEPPVESPLQAAPDVVAVASSEMPIATPAPAVLPPLSILPDIATATAPTTLPESHVLGIATDVLPAHSD